MFKMSTVGWYTCLPSLAVVFHRVVNGFLREVRANQLKCILNSGTVFDHAQSGVLHNCGRFCMYLCKYVCLSVCLSVCQTITSKDFTYEVHNCTSGVSPDNTGQVRTWRSSGQGQGHRTEKGPQQYTVYTQRMHACQDKSPSAQCNNSIANNSASTTHRAVKCACSIGFSPKTDRVSWPVSFLRYRK